MNYTEWFKSEFPELENNSGVNIAEYVEKAKSDTGLLCFLAHIFNLVILFALGYLIGFLFAKLINIEIIYLVAFCAVSGLLFFQAAKIGKILERRIIRKKLIEIVRQNT